jgi:DNA-binding protein HU-beta
MSKVEMVAKIAEVTGLTKKDSEAVVNAFKTVVEEALANGEDVSLSGFGKFTVVNRKERNGRNPKNGEPMVIPATKSPVFRVSSVLKAAVKNA